MESLEPKKKDWALTEQSFAGLLRVLDADAERAAQQYELVRRKLVQFFEWRGSNAPEDLADQTVDRIARKIDEGEKIQTFQSYAAGVARMIWFESLKRQDRQQKALDQLPPPTEAAESEDNGSTRRLECFDSCLNNLPAAARELILSYYRGDKRARIEARKELSRKLEVPPSALRLRAHRIRAQIDRCISDCVQF